MYVLLCRNETRESRRVRKLTGSETSHLALRFGEFVVAPYPKLTSRLQIVPLSVYLSKNEVIHEHLLTTNNVRLHLLLDQVHGKYLASRSDRLKFLLGSKLVGQNQLNLRGIAGCSLLEYFILDEYMAQKMSETPELDTEIVRTKILPYLRGK